VLGTARLHNRLILEEGVPGGTMIGVAGKVKTEPVILMKVPLLSVLHDEIPPVFAVPAFQEKVITGSTDEQEVSKHSYKKTEPEPVTDLSAACNQPPRLGVANHDMPNILELVMSKFITRGVDDIV
jgi:hypothetical protein